MKSMVITGLALVLNCSVYAQDIEVLDYTNANDIASEMVFTQDANYQFTTIGLQKVSEHVDLYAVDQEAINQEKYRHYFGVPKVSKRLAYGKNRKIHQELNTYGRQLYHLGLSSCLISFEQ